MEKGQYIVFHYYDEEAERHKKVAVSLYFLSRGHLSRTSSGREILWNFAHASPVSVDISLREMSWEEFRTFNRMHS